MATHTFTSTYYFKYRFTCEHCGKTSDWKTAWLQEKKEYQSGMGGRSLRLMEEEKFHKEFAAKVPALCERIEAGEYALPFSRLDGKCPACKKRQSWETVGDKVGSMIFVIVFCAALALVSQWRFNVADVAGNGRGQLFWLIAGGFGALGFLISLFFTIWTAKEKSAIKRDMEKSTVRNRPEFQWPEIN